MVPHEPATLESWVTEIFMQNMPFIWDKEHHWTTGDYL